MMSRSNSNRDSSPSPATQLQFFDTKPSTELRRYVPGICQAMIPVMEPRLHVPFRAGRTGQIECCVRLKRHDFYRVLDDEIARLLPALPVYDLRPCIDSYGSYFLWPIPVVADALQWSDSALSALAVLPQATVGFVQLGMTPERRYVIESPRKPLRFEPEFPSVDLSAAVDFAFQERTLDSPEHPIVQQLLRQRRPRSRARPESTPVAIGDVTVDEDWRQPCGNGTVTRPGQSSDQTTPRRHRLFRVRPATGSIRIQRVDGSVDDGAEIPSHIVEDLADASALLGVDPAAVEIRYIDDPQRSGKTDVPGGAIVMAPSAMVVIFRQSGERTLMLLNDDPSPSP